MSIYGDHLMFFPELMTEYDMYTMIPNIVAGLVPQSAEADKVRGIIRQMVIKRFDSSSKALVERNIIRFWTAERFFIDVYIVDEEGYLYRVKGHSSAKKEGNFYTYELENVKGASTQKRDNATVKWESQYD